MPEKENAVSPDQDLSTEEALEKIREKAREGMPDEKPALGIIASVIGIIIVTAVISAVLSLAVRYHSMMAWPKVDAEVLKVTKSGGEYTYKFKYTYKKENYEADVRTKTALTRRNEMPFKPDWKINDAEKVGKGEHVMIQVNPKQPTLAYTNRHIDPDLIVTIAVILATLLEIKLFLELVAAVRWRIKTVPKAYA